MMKNLKLYQTSNRNLIALCLILVLAAGITPCAKGCLKCNESGDACLICDSNSHYNLNDQGVCEKIEDLVNCKVTLHDVGKKECLQCMEDMVFDKTTGKCIDVPAASQVFGCEYYNQVGECASCKSEYYFQNGKCNETLLEVEHCLEFTDKSYCSVCEGARKFNPDSGKCEDFEPNTNCIGHIDYMCDECISGYNLQPNVFDNLVLYNADTGPNIEFVNSINIRKDFNGFWRDNPFPQCSVSEFTNCLVYTKQNNVITGCETCAAGYLKGSDGKCESYPLVQIENCATYNDGSTCITCVNKNYLNNLLSGNKCLPSTEVADCETYSQSNDACQTCVSTHFLQNSSTCVLRDNPNIVNCENYSVSSDQCQTCLDTFKLTDDGLACLTEIDGCDQYQTSSKDTVALACMTCSANMYPNESGESCLPQNVENCSGYDTNTNTCSQCADGYYQVGTTTISCSKKSVTNCETLKSGDDNNKCQRCNNLFKLNAEETCDSIDIDFCLENSARDDQCTKCSRGYYIDGGLCTQSTKTYDPLCTSGTQDGICDECSNGYIPFKLDGYLENLPNNCASADASSGECTQCEEDKDGTPSDGTNPPSCANAADTSGKCKQLSPSVFEALADNDTKCAKCRDLTQHYNSSQTCTDRPFHFTIHCGELQPDQEDCKACEMGYSLHNLNEKYSYCTKDQTGFSALNGCMVHNLFDTSKCLLCNADQKLDTNNACVALSFTPDSSNKFFYDFSTKKVISQPEVIEANVISDCTKYIFSSSNQSTIFCTECSAGNLLQAATENIPQLVNTTNSILGFSNKYGTSCVSGSTWIRHTATVSGEVTNCRSVINAATTVSSDVKCISCDYGYVPTFKQFNLDSADSSISAVTGVSACTLASSLGLSVTNNTVVNDLITTTSTNKFHQDEIYDTCSNTSQSPVSLIQASDRALVQNGASGSEVPSVNCLTLASGSQIENCKSHGATALTESAGETTLTGKICLACAPGFMRNSTFDKCVEIEDCDTASTNTLNNACETCKQGFSYEASSSTDSQFSMTSCAETPNHEKNCLVFDGDNCVLCKNGYDFDYEYKVCEPIDSTCTLKGFPHENLASITTTEDNTYDINSMLINNWFKDELQNGPLPCLSCPSGQNLYSVTSANHSDKVCVLNQYNREIIEGCEIFDGTNLNKCLTCKSEYLLNLDDDLCVRRSDKASHYKCEVLENTTTCKVCKRGYLPNSTGECEDPQNCLDDPNDYDSALKCQVCKEGYKPSTSTTHPFACERMETDDYFCGQRGGISSKCLKCKDCRKTPLEYLNASSNYTHSLCVFNLSSYSLTNYGLVIDESGTDKHKGMFKTSGLTAGKFFKTTFEGTTSIANYVCIRGPTDPYCKVWDTSVKYKCTQCEAGYYPNEETQRCVKGTIEGCVTYNYNNSQSCSVCDSEPSAENNYLPYYLNVNNCFRHHRENCRSYSSSNSSCTNCYNGYTLMNNGCEEVEDKPNCKVFTNNSTTCEECNEGYYLKSSDNTCHAYTVKNCDSYNTSADACLTCLDNFYLSNISCVENTCTNCLEKSKTQNRCETCPADGKNYYRKLDVGCVEHVPIPNCQSYSNSMNKCGVCEDGYYPSNNVCAANPTGIANCGVYTDMTNCFSCISGYFIQNNVCETLTITVTDCVIYSADGVCSTCDTGKLLSTDGTSCSTPNESSCATWTDTDNCASCAGNTYLSLNDDSKNVCKPTNIAHCLTAEVNNNEPSCTMCSPGFILKEGQCNSPKIIINDCELYDVESEKCLTCFDGFILSNGKDKCNTIVNNSVDFCAKGTQPEEGKYVCNLCKWGSYKNNEGECETCGGEGCAICDKSDRTKCALCMSTYYMTSTYSCSLNDPPTIDDSVKVTQAMIVFLFIALLMKWDN